MNPVNEDYQGTTLDYFFSNSTLLACCPNVSMEAKDNHIQRMSSKFEDTRESTELMQ